MTAIVNIRPPLAVATLTLPQTQVKGGATTTGTVTLNRAVGTTTTVSFTSSNPSICAAPRSVMLPPGQTSATFTLVPNAVVSPTTVTIGAAVPGTAATTMSVTIIP